MSQNRFYDRVEIYIDNIPYLPDGQIRRFSMSATYNTKINQGFSPDGKGTGKTIGNTVIDDVSWTEFFPQQADYLNWRTFCLANPNAVILVIPVSLATGAPTATPFTITGMDPTNVTVAAPGEGEVMTRDCKFNAISSSNL